MVRKLISYDSELAATARLPAAVEAEIRAYFDIPDQLTDLGTIVTGAELDALKTKVDGVEAGAQLTNATRVDAAGAVMNTDTSTAAMAFVVNEATMTSNSATKVPTQASVKSYVDAAVAAGGGGGSGTFDLTPITTRTSSYTASAGQYVPVDSSGGSAITITLPTAPANKSLVAVYIRNVQGIITLAAPAGAELLVDGSSVTTMPLFNPTTGYTPLSLWQYSSTGAFWSLIAYTTLPFASDIYNSTVIGRSLITAADTAAAKAALGLGNVDNTSDAAKWNATKTLANTKVQTRAVAATLGSTITPNITITDQLNIDALSLSTTIADPSGVPTDGQQLLIRIKDDGTSRALAYGSIYRAIGVDLPLATVAGKVLYIGCRYNAADSRWDVIAVGVES
jgi:hypothetical protein